MKYPFLTALAVIIALAAWFLNLGVFTPQTALAFVVVGQLALATFSKRQAACFVPSITAEQVQEFEDILRGLKAEFETYKGVPELVQQLERDVRTMRRSNLQRGFGGSEARPRGRISDDAAGALGAAVILHVAKAGKLEALVTDNRQRDLLLTEARQVAGISQRTALTTSDVPLPTTYSGQLNELIAEFGVARNELTLYPMSGGTNKPPRMGTRPAFGSIAMSAAFGEKSPTLGFAALESHKIGGIVITPREIEDQSIVRFGQFMAIYGAVEFARAEDTWAFLADGTSTYESVTGICKTASDNSKAVTLAAGKTAPSDAVLADFRAMRRLVSTACLARGGKYYLNATWEARLRAFNNNANDPYVFTYRPDGTALLDGFPIVWTEVLTPYDTAAAVSSNLAVFGNLKFWWMGERGMPRIDTSMDVLFQYDQLATRFIEEIDFDYNSLSAASTLKTPAA